MAKRFYDTGLVDQEWYMDLTPKCKALYMHLLCKCDVAGVFEVNCRMMSAYINDTVTRDDIFNSFGKRVIQLPGSESKGMLVDFISFQCGGCVNPKVKAHQAILKRLEELGIALDDVCSWSTHGLRRIDDAQIDGCKKDKGKAEKDRMDDEQCYERKSEESEIEDMFECFWLNYPRHDAKKIATQSERAELLSKMLYAIKNCKNSEQWQKQDGQFIPMPTTWLNQMRWEDEGITDQMSPDAAKEHATSTAQTIAAKLRM